MNLCGAINEEVTMIIDIDTKQITTMKFSKFYNFLNFYSIIFTSIHTMYDAMLILIHTLLPKILYVISKTDADHCLNLVDKLSLFAELTMAH